MSPKYCGKIRGGGGGYPRENDDVMCHTTPDFRVGQIPRSRSVQDWNFRELGRDVRDFQDFQKSGRDGILTLGWEPGNESRICRLSTPTFSDLVSKKVENILNFVRPLMWRGRKGRNLSTFDLNISVFARNCAGFGLIRNRFFVCAKC